MDMEYLFTPVADEDGKPIWNKYQAAYTGIYEDIFNSKADTECIGIGLYISSSEEYAKKLRMYVKNNAQMITEPKDQTGFLRVYFSLCRAHESYKLALINAMGLNNMFIIPLNNALFFSAISTEEHVKHSSEHYSVRKGRFWTPDSIAKMLCRTKQELGIGTRAIRREKSVNYHSAIDNRRQRVLELYNSGTKDPKAISSILANEGHAHASEKTIGRDIDWLKKNDLL